MNHFSKFIVAGVLNSLLGYSIIFALMYLGMSPEISNASGYGVGLITSYLFNRIFVFNSNQNKTKEWLSFLIVFGIAYSANFIVLLISVRVLKISLILSQIFAGIAYIVFSFFMNKYYVFGYRQPKNIQINIEI